MPRPLPRPSPTAGAGRKVHASPFHPHTALYVCTALRLVRDGPVRHVRLGRDVVARLELTRTWKKLADPERPAPCRPCERRRAWERGGRDGDGPGVCSLERYFLTFT